MTIREARAEKGITQNELAEMVKVKRSTVAMWETGSNKPRAEMIKKLAEVLGCTADELLGIEKESGQAAKE